MNKYIGTALLTTALLAQMQIEVCAQSSNQVESQLPQLQPALPGTLDNGLRGPIGGQTTTQSSSPAPFSTSSPYSYSEPANHSSYESQPSVADPVPSASPSSAAPTPSKTSTPARTAKQKKKHGFSPVGAVFGLPDRVVKTSLGLTDRTAKAGLGITGKTTKEVLKTVF